VPVGAPPCALSVWPPFSRPLLSPAAFPARGFGVQTLNPKLNPKPQTLAQEILNPKPQTPNPLSSSAISRCISCAGVWGLDGCVSYKRGTPVGGCVSTAPETIPHPFSGQQPIRSYRRAFVGAHGPLGASFSSSSAISRCISCARVGLCYQLGGDNVSVLSAVISLPRVGLCYQLGGDNVSVLSAVVSLPADSN